MTIDRSGADRADTHSINHSGYDGFPMTSAARSPVKRLVIVESPTKARTLGPMLGPGYMVRASMGHVRDLPPDALGVDIDHDFRPAYRLARGKAKTVQALRAAAADADEIYLSTDPDREGEAIAWHLLQVLRPRQATVRRVTFHEVTPSAIQAAFAAPRPGLDLSLVDAQQARRVLDRLVGYQVSPLLWKTTRGKSAGRVQSVALRLVVERERDIRAFTPEEYWTIHADLARPADHAQHFLARLIQAGGQPVGLDKPIQLKTRADADRLIAELQGAQYRVKTVKREKRARKPWPPFTTSTLQQSASARLGLSPADTMRIAQELYEGIDVGTGKPVGLITYMRTDSTHVSPEAQAQARQVVESTLGARYLPERPPAYATRVKNAQEAHEAIRPTDTARYPSTIKSHLSERQFKLYDLIWRRFVASQMAPAEYRVTTVDVEARGAAAGAAAGAGQPRAFLFRAVGRELLFDGFLRVWQEAPERADDEDEPQVLPELAPGEPLDLLELLARQHFTQPPPRYTEATLIKALEDRGIGRPSTYASIVGTLKDRDYVVSEKRVLSPTPLGETTCDALVAAFPDVLDYGFTAQVEDWLDEVSRGEKAWTQALRDFYTPFERQLHEAADKMRAFRAPPAVEPSSATPPSASPGDQAGDVEPGPSNRSARRTRRSGAGKRRASADHTPRRPAAEAATAPTATAPTATAPAATATAASGGQAGAPPACPKCGAPMVPRTSQYGPFLGCSRFPKCRGILKVAGQA
jgi:DNA topoisomerase-1